MVNKFAIEACKLEMRKVRSPFSTQYTPTSDSLRDSSCSRTNKIFFSKQRGKIMKGRSLFSLTIGLTILCAWSLSVFAESRQTTQRLNHSNHLPNTQAQSRRRIQFQICSESQSWVRPTEAEHIARLKSLPRYAGHEVNSRFWTDNIFLFTSYGLSARHEPIFMSGLWTIEDSAFQCYNPQGISQKINSGELAEVLLLQHKVKKVEWQDNHYIMVVYPVEKGVQFIQFPRVERQFPLILKVVAENETELATLSAPGSPIVTARLLRVKQATGNSQMISWSQTIARQPKSQLITWREFVEQGGGREIRTDYDLPEEFRNGFVYFNYKLSAIQAYIFKSGLSSYPPLNGGRESIDAALGEKYVKSGKAIKFYWNLGNSGLKYANDTQVRFSEKGTGRFGSTYLTAPFMTNEQISRILRSGKPIPQKN